MDGAAPLPAPRRGLESNRFVRSIRLEPDVDREPLIARLEERGIPSRPYFSPIHLQPLYVERFGYKAGDFPNAEQAGRATLALPFHTLLHTSEVEHIVEALRIELPAARRSRARVAVAADAGSKALARVQAPFQPSTAPCRLAQDVHAQMARRAGSATRTRELPAKPPLATRGIRI